MDPFRSNQCLCVVFFTIFVFISMATICPEGQYYKPPPTTTEAHTTVVTTTTKSFIGDTGPIKIISDIVSNDRFVASANCIPCNASIANCLKCSNESVNDTIRCYSCADQYSLYAPNNTCSPSQIPSNRNAVIIGSVCGAAAAVLLVAAIGAAIFKRNKRKGGSFRSPQPLPNKEEVDRRNSEKNNRVSDIHRYEIDRSPPDRYISPDEGVDLAVYTNFEQINQEYATGNDRESDQDEIYMNEEENKSANKNSNKSHNIVSASMPAFPSDDPDYLNIGGRRKGSVKRIA